MAHRVRKLCPACQQLFVGRRDAKTCSDRCRKRLQRARVFWKRDLKQNLEPAGNTSVPLSRPT